MLCFFRPSYCSLASLLFLYSVTSFSIHSVSYSSLIVRQLSASASIDEYDDNDDDDIRSTIASHLTLSSSYPPETPAGLRGEAVQSALRSKCCVAWHFEQSSLAFGVIQIQGPGCLEFLNHKLTQSFHYDSSSTDHLLYQHACLLNAKGQLVDMLGVAYQHDTAFLLTSPGHSAKTLLQHYLEPFVFPLDRITLSYYMENAFIFTMASTQRESLNDTWNKVVHHFATTVDLPSQLPPTHPTTQHAIQSSQLLIVPDCQLPQLVACYGYTFVCWDCQLGKDIWTFLTANDDWEGPVPLGELEYETLRIEAGQPSFYMELQPQYKVSPLEIHWQQHVNLEKGCYLGQEGIAALIKNPRGPPRLLYQVVFEDELNVYETNKDNLTRVPHPGDTLYVLGSNEEIAVGTITSVAEPGGTGARNTLALALIRRTDSILKQMKDRQLQLPPKRSTLDGLEVIVGGTYTVGTLQDVPSQRLEPGKLLFNYENEIYDDVMEDSEEDEEHDDEALKLAVKQAEADAEAAAAEAKRKAEKMELLRKRAEEAMARRKTKEADGS